MTQPLSQTLKGIGELFAFVPSAVERFSTERRDVLRSFIWPVVIYFLVAWGFWTRSGQPGPDVLLVHAVIVWAGFFGYYALVCYLCRAMRRGNEIFLRFVHVSNAQSILNFILLLPIFWTLATDPEGGAFFDQYWLFFIFADLAYSAFIAAKSLRLNLPLGAFLAVTSLFLTDTGNRLVELYMG